MSFLSSPYMSSFVGFESLFDEIERMSSVKQSPYPAYDIKKLSNNSFLIVLALAGFSSEDLMIEATSRELNVCGNGNKNDHHEYIHKGIAKRAFTKTFRLADNVIVDKAEFKDGLLSIHLYKEEPKKELPKKIPIKS
jgi:molecular chaperone IbpA